MARAYNNLRVVIYTLFLSVILFGQIHIPAGLWDTIFGIDTIYEIKKAELNAKEKGKTELTISEQGDWSYISISNPITGGNYRKGDSLKIQTMIYNPPQQETPYLKINCTDHAFRKLKIGYNSTNLYNPKNDVIHGGNTEVEIILKEITANINWNKIQIRPQGNIISPVVIGNYINSAVILNDGYKKITIPVTSFNGEIDFSQLTLIEFPYSAGAGVFEIQLQAISFTGGNTPFLWFGGNKTDNITDGLGAGGQLNSTLIIPVSEPKIISGVVFYQNNTLLGMDNTEPYEYTWKNLVTGNYSLTAKMLFADGGSISSVPVDINVSAVSGLKVTLIFDSIPQNYAITNSTLRYNKDFAYSFTLDDTREDAYTRAYPVLAGGYIDFNNTTYPGLFYTDGCGNNIPFRAGIAWNSENNSGQDLHMGTPGYLTWTQLSYLYSKNWNVFNHSLSHKTGTGTDYEYQVTGNNNAIKEKTGITVTHFVTPGGDNNYEAPAFNNGMKAIYNQSGNYPGIGGIKVDAIELNQFRLNRQFISDDKFNTSNITAQIDAVAAKSINGNHYWYNDFTHRVEESPYGGSLVFSTFEYYMKYIEHTYGKNGKDNIWMVPLQDIYEYLVVRNTIQYAMKLEDNRLEILFDTTNVPGDLLKYALTLKVASNVSFQSIETNGFFQTSFNGSGNNKLVNLEWKGPAKVMTEPAMKKTNTNVEVSKINGATIRKYFNIYPNPSSDKITIRFTPGFDKEVKMKMFNEMGEIVSESEVKLVRSSDVQMDLSPLPKGTYFLKIYAKDFVNETVRIAKN